MISSRDIENLSISSIQNELNDYICVYDKIIDNASQETYKIKQNFSSTLLKFISMVLAPMLLTSFILYNNIHNNKQIFIGIIIVILIILICYDIQSFFNFYKAYKRQKTYRDVKKAIEIINNNINIFFNVPNIKLISSKTIGDFLTEIIKSYNIKNKKLLKIILKYEWIGFPIAILGQVIIFIIIILL